MELTEATAGISNAIALARLDYKRFCENPDSKFALLLAANGEKLRHCAIVAYEALLIDESEPASVEVRHEQAHDLPS